MNIHDATETAYHNGYQQAVKDILAELKKVGIDEWRYPIIGDLKTEYLEGKK